MIIGIAVTMALAASVAVFANAHDSNSTVQSHETTAASFHMEGKHCNGTVGCSCSGFKPITNQEVWKKSYCKNCGHHKNCHR